MAQNLADLLRGDGIQNEFLEKLPVSQKKRVCALKKLQLDTLEVEADFYERVHQLEKEFEAKFNNIYEKRKTIVNGDYEPTEAESEMAIIHGLEEEELKRLYDSSEADNGEKGIGEFWLQVLRGSDIISDMIQEHDEPILKHLTDITSTVESSPPGFTLYFHFSPNPYFKNTTLKKHYHLEMRPNKEDPFEYDGPTVINAIGDNIEWEDGKNVTRKVVKKKAKKGANAGKFLTKTVDNESFFNFFNPPTSNTINEDDDNADDFAKMELQRADFEVGQTLRDHVIPRAVLFFTGEADIGDDGSFDYGDEEEEEDPSDDEDDEE